MSWNILIVDDDPGMQSALNEVLKKRGYEGELAGSAEEALEKMEEKSFDLLLLDIMLPGMSGLEAIPKIKQLANQGEIILMTAHGSKDVTLEAISMGAYDYFTKPFSLKEMDVVIKRALEKRRLEKELSQLKCRFQSNGPLSRIIGESECMKGVKAVLEKIAPLDTTVLITGESGTGKELIADVIHALSKRASGPFVKINCASIPENLLESELCGHEKGAFTGAALAKPGKFELADGGSILMDEIGDMPFSLQAKLLRLVEQKGFERLGGSKTLSVDVRIIAATNQDLKSLIKEKNFREDLYYRLNVGTVHLPPLRERKEDLPLLAQYFIHQINRKLGTRVSGISREGLDIVTEHDWPGNIREFANTLERAVIMSSGAILSAQDMRMTLSNRPYPPHGDDKAAPISLGETLDNVERNLILNALRKCGGKQCGAAKLLGLNPKNLWKKIQKHGLQESNEGMSQGVS
ncbi:sigma-54 dependent transcriptional regulator [Desulforhabdus sp. TSK]|uniref:sigma-54-dependent transcriptional regulator n=1 Tax=Desulforhabdus sp. TSK TaxID=2925014 RepID=UPI001FC84511|nr:sigma-54 dependent transcriptional regulator [Desulforhabdus sp. TSK]GKT09313.1 sigma-54-dependent Fis family transcriptional regulator [Desulforhabdus sp. TSK]